jgi:hypothetical protein
MLAGNLAAGGAGGAAGITAATDLRGGEDRSHLQNPTPRIATTISPEIHFRGLRIGRQRFATGLSASPPETL